MLLSPRILARLRESIESAMKDAWEEISQEPGVTVVDLDQAVRKACNDAISSVARGIEHWPLQLPEEIWGLIWSSLPSLKDLVTVTHVCRAWREVALDIPDLWATVSVKRIQHARTCARRLAVLLERSKHAPLEIALGVSGARYSDTDEPLALVRNMLGKHCTRLVSFDVTLPSHRHLRPFLVSFDALPLLRHLALSTDDRLSVSLLGLVGMPKLVTLKTGNSVTWDTVIMTAPGLLAISTSACSVTELANILRSFPALVDLDVCLEMRDWSGTTAELESVTRRCGNLQRLRLSRLPRIFTADQLATLVHPGAIDVSITVKRVKRDWRSRIVQPIADTDITIALFTLGHLTGPTRLTIESNSNDAVPPKRNFDIIARDEHRSRRLQLSPQWPTASSIPRLWAHINTRSLVFMDVPSGWIYRFFVLTTHPAFPALEHISFSFPLESPFVLSAPVAEHRVAEPATIPSLRRITLQCSGGHTEFPAAVTAQFVEQLLRGRRIDTLEIRNVQFNGSVQRLEALTDEVTTTFDPVEQPSLLFG